MSTILGLLRFLGKPASMALWTGLALAPVLPRPALAEPLLIRIESGRVAEPLLAQPAAVTVVERSEEPVAAPDADLGELLDAVPGVFASARANAAQDLRLSIRGFGARGNFGIRGIRVLVDGFPATLPDGQTTVDDIDPALIERVEVRRGPAGSLYGPAAGGVVSFTTRPAFDSAGGTQAALGVGSYSAWSAQLSHDRTRLDRNGVDWALQGDVSARARSGYREQSAQQHRYLNLQLNRRDTRGLFELLLVALDSPFAEDPGGLTAAERERDRRAAGALNLRFDTGERVEQQRLGLRYSRALAAGGEARFSGYLLRRDFANRLPFSATGLDRDAGGLSMQLERRGRPLDIAGLELPWRWLAGVDLDQQRDDRRRFVNDDGQVGALTAAQDERVTALGGFGQLQLGLSPQTSLQLGLRADRVAFRLSDRFGADGDQSGERVFRQLSPTAGLSWRRSAALNLYARVSRAFETPTTTELANPSGAGGFNAEVQAQITLGVETGLRWRAGERFSGELALFDSRVEDQLVPQPIPGQPGRFYYVNAASSRYRGVEASLGADLARRWRFAGSATLARYRFGEFRDAGGVYDGNRVPGIPEYQLAMRLDYRPDTDLSARFGLLRVSSRAVDNANSARAAAYTLADLRATYRLPGAGGRLRATVGVDNLFATEYEDNVRINASGGRFYEPAAGRTFHLSIAAEL